MLIKKLTVFYSESGYQSSIKASIEVFHSKLVTEINLTRNLPSDKNLGPTLLIQPICYT